MLRETSGAIIKPVAVHVPCYMRHIEKKSGKIVYRCAQINEKWSHDGIVDDVDDGINGQECFTRTLTVND